MDMTEGIVARFRTMAIARTSVLTGHVVGSVIQTMLALGIVMVVALLIGFRPTTGPVEWLAAAGLLALAALAISWLSVALGHGGRAASRPRATCPMFLVLLPFLSSGFVPTESMPGRPELVRREPAVHADHRDGAGPAARDADRRQRHRSPSAGASRSRSLGYLWARRLYDRNPAP